MKLACYNNNTTAFLIPTFTFKTSTAVQLYAIIVYYTMNGDWYPPLHTKFSIGRTIKLDHHRHWSGRCSGLQVQRMYTHL